MQQNDTRADSKHRYHKITKTIAANVGHPQPPFVEAGALWTIAVSHGTIQHHEAQTSLQAARENGDVIRWTDADGRTCYSLTDSGIENTPNVEQPLLSVDDEQPLRDIIETEASRDDPDRDVIGWVNRRLAGVDG